MKEVMESKGAVLSVERSGRLMAAGPDDVEPFELYSEIIISDMMNGREYRLPIPEKKAREINIGELVTFKIERKGGLEGARKQEGAEQ